MAEEMTFDADASKAWSELAKLRQQWLEIEKVLSKSATTSEKAAKTASEALKLQSETTKALVAQIHELKNATDKAKTSSDQLGSTMKGAADLAAGGFRTMLSVLGVGGVLSVVKELKAAKEEWTKKVYETQKAQDEVARKFRVQSLMNQKEFQAVLGAKLMPVAQTTAMPLRDVQEAATEMYSKGFSMPDILGGEGKESALQALLLGAQASKYTGSKIDFANAIASYLKSTGQDLSAENVTGALAPLVTLFQTTGIESTDLLAIAELSAFMKSYGAQQQEMFAAVGVMKDFGGLTASEGLTKLRNVMQILGAPGANKEVADTLKAVGGEGLADTLDFVGENLGQVLENLDAAMAGLGRTPEENTAQRHVVMSQLFGARNAAAAETLLKHREKLTAYAKLQQDTGKYVEGIKRGTEGPFAASIRQDNAMVFAELKNAETMAGQERFSKELEILDEEEGVNPWLRSLNRTLGWWQYGRDMMPPEEAAELRRKAEERLAPPEVDLTLPKAEEIREVKPAARGSGRAPIDFSRLSRDSTDTSRYRTPEQVELERAELVLARVELEHDEAERSLRAAGRGELTPMGKRQLRDKFGARRDAARAEVDTARIGVKTAELGRSAEGQRVAAEQAAAAAVQPVSEGGKAVTPGEKAQIELLQKQYQATLDLVTEMRKSGLVKVNVNAHKEAAAGGAKE